MTLLIHLYGDMHQFFVDKQLMSEAIGFNLFGNNKGEDAGIFALADTPHMQIRYVGRNRTLFDDFQYFSDHGCVHLGIKQHATGVAKEPIRPDGHHTSANYTHNRIKPVCTPVFPSCQCANGKH